LKEFSLVILSFCCEVAENYSFGLLCGEYW